MLFLFHSFKKLGHLGKQIPTYIGMCFFTVLKCYLAVGQKHLKKSRVSVLHSASPDHSAEWLFPLLLPQFHPRQRRKAGP